jgi:hypothetical protein
VNRRLLAVALLLLALRSPALGQPAFGIRDAECFDDGTLVGRTSDLRLATLRNDQWQPLSFGKGVLRLWRSPDGRIFAIASGDNSWLAVQVPKDSGPSTRWTVPTDFGAIRFTSLDGAVDVVTHDRLYRLDPGGTATAVGQTPLGGSGQPLRNRAPEILVSRGTTVVCTGTSEHEDDNVGGSCRESRGAYVYRVDFGEPLCCESEAPHFAAPFVCGEVVISTLGNWRPSSPRARTQARALATGALVGRATGAARRGSTCLDGQRALLVGRRDIRIVSVPGLRTIRRHKTVDEIGAVAVCGGMRAIVVPQNRPDSVQAFDVTALAGLGSAQK